MRTDPGAVAADGHGPASDSKFCDEVSTTMFRSIGFVDVFTATSTS